jgi:hypothetical protein
MKELLIDMEQATARELEQANKLHSLFNSLHQSYGILAEEIAEAKEAFEETERMFDRFFMCVRKDDYSSANDYLAYIKKNAIDCAAEMVQVAAMAQKAIDSNAVEKKTK